MASTGFVNSADTANECIRKSSSSATPPTRIFHNTITLSGNRGSGKTSFLLSLLNDPCVTKDAFVLPIIDPTLIEDKGHIFLNIISRIKDQVDDVINENKTVDECVKMWRNSLKELAQGLPTLEGVGASVGDWNDPTYVMERGLQGVHGANHLAANFHRYVTISLKLLGKKVFIMAFDDVDTDFSKGWPVLETLRKYLTSPQLITILSGDLDLYSLLIRKKQ